jgi:hypothetical protein
MSKPRVDHVYHANESQVMYDGSSPDIGVESAPIIDALFYAT